MIRRWARVNKLNENLIVIKKKYFNFFFVTFKRSIIFKKYRVKHTRFIRKALVKAKHKGNWSIYLQIFKNWVLDFKFAKAYVKFQLFNEIFWFSAITYDFCHFNLKQFNDYQPRFFLSDHLSKTMRHTLSPFKESWDFKHSPSITSYLTSPEQFDFFQSDKPIHFPIYLRTGELWIFLDFKKKFEPEEYKFKFCEFLNDYDKLSYRQINEIYKILNLSWIFLLFQS